MLKRAAFWAGLALLIAFLGYAATRTSSFGQCQTSREAGYANKNQPDLFEKANTFIVCEGVAVDANGLLITALATVAIAWFTLSLRDVSADQASLTRESINLATREFTAAYPPAIAIHSFQRLPKDENGMRSVEVRYINTGVTEATIVEIAGLTTDAGEPIPPGIDLPIIQRFVGTIGRGRDETFVIIETGDIIIDPDHLHEEYFLFCIGRIIYEDATGRQRRTGFCRKWEPNHREWQKVENPEYEYTY